MGETHSGVRSSPFLLRPSQRHRRTRQQHAFCSVQDSSPADCVLRSVLVLARVSPESVLPFLQPRRASPVLNLGQTSDRKLHLQPYLLCATGLSPVEIASLLSPQDLVCCHRSEEFGCGGKAIGTSERFCERWYRGADGAQRREKECSSRSDERGRLKPVSFGVPTCSACIPTSDALSPSPIPKLSIKSSASRTFLASRS